MCYNPEDAKNWADYLEEAMNQTLERTVRTFRREQRNLFPHDPTDQRSLNKIRKSTVVLVLISPYHVDCLLTDPNATYNIFVPDAKRGILLLLGVLEKDLESLRTRFPQYDSWMKFNQNGEGEEIQQLLEELEKRMMQAEVLSRPKLNTPVSAPMPAVAVGPLQLKKKIDFTSKPLHSIDVPEVCEFELTPAVIHCEVLYVKK